MICLSTKALEILSLVWLTGIVCNSSSFIPHESIAKIESITHNEQPVSIREGIECFFVSLNTCTSVYINLSLKISFDCALAAKLTASIIHKDKKYNFIII